MVFSSAHRSAQRLRTETCGCSGRPRVTRRAGSGVRRVFELGVIQYTIQRLAHICCINSVAWKVVH